MANLWNSADLPGNSIIPEIIYRTGDNRILYSQVNSTLNRSQIFFYFILTGGSLTLLYFLYGHLQIRRLIKQSECIKYKNITVVEHNKHYSPFIYNNIAVISKSIPPEERPLIIQHEYSHYILGHHIDNYFLQLFQIIFWMNPWFYLLKNDLKLIHEYQVDDRLIRSGVDASKYKLALIRFSVGDKKFAIANKLTNCKIKNRIAMMNKTTSKKWNWRLLITVPFLCTILVLLSFTNTKSHTARLGSQEGLLIHNSADSIAIELLSLPDLKNEYRNNPNITTVFINYKSNLMVNGKKCMIDEVPVKISASYGLEIQEKHDVSNPDFPDRISGENKIIVQKDIRTNKAEYDVLLDKVSAGIYLLQEKYSNKLYKESYKSLSAQNKEKINSLIQLRIYIASDKKMYY